MKCLFNFLISIFCRSFIVPSTLPPSTAPVTPIAMHPEAGSAALPCRDSQLKVSTPPSDLLHVNTSISRPTCTNSLSDSPQGLDPALPGKGSQSRSSPPPLGPPSCSSTPCVQSRSPVSTLIEEMHASRIPRWEVWNDQVRNNKTKQI